MNREEQEAVDIMRKALKRHEVRTKPYGKYSEYVCHEPRDNAGICTDGEKAEDSLKKTLISLAIMVSEYAIMQQAV